MIEVGKNQRLFAINNNVAVTAVSYELYSTNDIKTIISSFNLLSIQNLELLLDLKISFEFSQIDQQDIEFSDRNTYDVRDVYNFRTGTVDVEMALGQVSTSNLYAYVRIYDPLDPENTYDKLFKEKIIGRNILVSDRYVDYSIQNASSYISDFRDSRELQDQFIADNFNQIENFSYLTDLFYFFRKNNQVNCFFGVDTEGYIKDNNVLKFLNEDIDFISYIRKNNCIDDIQGYVYANKEHVFINPAEIDIDLQEVMGRVYGFTFDVPKEFEKSYVYGYEAQISFKDTLSDYLTEELLPILRKENTFLREMNIEGSNFKTIDSFQLFKTFSTYTAYLSTVIDNSNEIMAFFLTTPVLALNNQLRSILLSVNQSIYSTIIENLRTRQISSSPSVTITKDFGQVMDLSRIDCGVEIIAGNPTLGLINSYNLEDIVDRSDKELQKYFSGRPTAIDAGGTEIATTNNSSAFLSATDLFIDNKKILNNEKSPNDIFTYNEKLEYLNTINKIVSKNVQMEQFSYPNKKITGLTDQEVITEDSTTQNNMAISSIIVEEASTLGDTVSERDILSIRENIVKSFEVPSILTSNLRAEQFDPNQPLGGTTSKVDIDGQSFFGNNLISFGVLNKIRNLKDNDFYEPYIKILSSTAQQLEVAPIQALYLFDYYKQELDSPDYLQPENLLGEITCFGVNYHNFKSLFSMRVYLNSENDFVLLSRNVLNSLRPNTNYLCRIDHHHDINYGIATPELLKTSIYNKYFILTT